MQMEYSLEKMCAFLSAQCLHRIPCLFHVWTLPEVSDKSEIMGELLSGEQCRCFIDIIKSRETKPRCHLLLKIRQMAIQTFGFARLCFIQQRQKRHTKVLKLSHDLRTQSVECSKLGKTRIIEDANIRLVRNATFLNRISI